jgi:hypothetical protein
MSKPVAARVRQVIKRRITTPDGGNIRLLTICRNIAAILRRRHERSVHASKLLFHATKTQSRFGPARMRG